MRTFNLIEEHLPIVSMPVNMDEDEYACYACDGYLDCVIDSYGTIWPLGQMISRYSSFGFNDDSIPSYIIGYCADSNMFNPIYVGFNEDDFSINFYMEVNR